MRILTLAVLLTALSSPAIAKPVTYLCQMKGNAKGWIRPQIILQVDRATGQARVLDDIVYSVHGKAIPGALEVTDAKSVVSWTVLVEDRRGQDTRMKYRAAIVKNNRAVVTAVPDSAYSGRFTGRGQCRLSNQQYPGM